MSDNVLLFSLVFHKNVKLLLYVAYIPPTYDENPYHNILAVWKTV